VVKVIKNDFLHIPGESEMENFGFPHFSLILAYNFVCSADILTNETPMESLDTQLCSKGSFVNINCILRKYAELKLDGLCSWYVKGQLLLSY
jgi:hypothetical protein